MVHQADKNAELMTDCHDICLRTASHCLEKGSNHARPEHITVLLDCAEICQTSADFMLRGSNLHNLTCAVCAEICDRCAESCESIRDGDSMMKECARICRECSKICRQMAGSARVAQQVSAS